LACKVWGIGMTSPKSKEQVVPEDIRDLADRLTCVSGLATRADDIARAILAERERCNNEIFERLQVAFRRGANWQYINGDHKKLGVAQGLNKAAYDYADYETSPLPTPPKGGEE
jgi:hypothetical protein